MGKSLAALVSSSLLLSIAVPSLCGTAVAQSRTWIVDAAMGPGTDFTQVGAAVAASRSGDTILVRAGVYQELTGFRISRRGLTIVGEGNPEIQFASPVPGAQHHLWIQDAAPGQPVVLAGLTLRGSNALGPIVSVGVNVCDDLVAFHDLAAPAGSGIRLRLYVSASERVHIDNASADFVEAEFWYARAELTSCVWNRAEIECYASVLDIDSSYFRNDPVNPLAIDSSISLQFANVRLARTTFEGVWTQGNRDGSAVFSYTSSITLDPTSALVPFGFAPAISGHARRTDAEWTSLDVDRSPSGLTIDLQGSMGDSYAVLLSLAPLGPPLLQDLWIDPAAHFVLASGVLSNSRTTSMAVPLGPGVPAGLAATVQGITLGREFRLSNGAAVVFR